ncbi:MAG TPA: bacillithiol biosynthesis BshC [Thermoanaerobaculia bacterium]
MTLRVPLQHYPGFNPFVLDWLTGNERATQFLPRVKSAPKRGGRRGDPELIAALADFNRHLGLFIQPELERWAAGETLTIIGGQQTGFAGGPLYTLAKICSLLKMKRDIERAGTPATVMFWMATEDHDFDEVAQLAVPVRTVSRDVNRQLDLLCVRATRTVESKLAVGRQPVPEPLIMELLALYGFERPSWLRAGITFGESFAELIANVFGKELIIIDSLLPELRRAGAPLFDSIFRRWDDVEGAVLKRSNDLASCGYSPQVGPRERESYSLLFELDDNFERHVIDRPRAVPPERVSTSALTRPLLQDFVLQPDVFVGGPAEVAYYAQLAPLHEMLGVPMPRVALRGHALVAPRRMLRFIDRYELNADELFTSPDHVLAEREPEGVERIRGEAESAKRQLMQHIGKIGEIALPADHALARAINRSIGHIEYHFNKLTERAIRGLVRKDKERYAAAKELIATLYPDRHVQDRVVAWFPFWRQHGRELIDRMVEDIEPDAPSFSIIGV